MLGVANFMLYRIYFGYTSSILYVHVCVHVCVCMCVCVHTHMHVLPHNLGSNQMLSDIDKL